jgi:hypothetical protein
MIGAGVEAFAQIFSYLFEVVCKRSMLNDDRGKRLYDGMLHGFGKILAKAGISGFYRWFWVRFVKEAPSAALEFIFFGAFTKARIRFKTPSEPPLHEIPKPQLCAGRECAACKKQSVAQMLLDCRSDA